MFLHRWTICAVMLVVTWTSNCAEATRDKLKERTSHWAFQPATRPIVPNLKFANPIDAFVEQRRAKEGLKGSSPAHRSALARRLYLNLTGIPPTPQEMARFLNDKSIHAWENLTDQLLSSPRYGERWARYWLDIVHFGESHGYDKDKPRPNAWPYRDYVIQAANRDIPYSRFVQEQLAGDVLFPNDPQATIATGFIAAGPWDFVGHVELPESKMDGLIARYNDRDDMVMTTMTTFLSLTVHCARCHDHKFDPIPQQDYYSLQAVFAGVDRADRAIEIDPNTAKQRKALLTEKTGLEEIIAKIEKLKDQGKPEEAKKKRLSTIGYHSSIEKTQDAEKWVQLDFPMEIDIQAVALIPAFEQYGGHPGPGFGFPARFRVDISNDSDFRTFTTVRDETKSDFPHPGGSPIITSANTKAKHVRITATKLWKRTNDYIFALGEAWVISHGQNVASNATVSALDSIEAAPSWAKKNLHDGIAVATKTEFWKQWLVFENIEQTLPKQTLEELRDAKTRLAKVEEDLKKLPPTQLIYAAASDFKPNGNFKPAGKPRAVQLLRRGDVKYPQYEVKPGALTYLPNQTPTLETQPEKESTRRAALAKWLTDEKNFLLRRSIVNRAWQFHFGRGLIDTPNDFGHLGSLPTHPELLDWLAFWFIDHGESLKALHKLIVTSDTYQQSSADNAEYEKLDGDNRFLWRMNRARLDSEQLRDSMLFVSGQLDLRMGGPSDQQFLFKDDHSPIYDYTQFDVDSPAGRRRSIYRFIVRSVPDPWMESLDCPDPSLLTGKRNITLTAMQALATLNNPFVIAQSEHLAARVRAGFRDIESQINGAFELALNRPANPAERKRLAGYANQHSLPAACRLIFNLSEFAFVD